MNIRRVILITSAFIAAYSAMFVRFVLAWASSRYGAEALGLTLLSGMLPGLLITFLSGVVADKWEPRTSLAASAAIRAAVLVGMALFLPFYDTPLVFIVGNFILHLVGNIFADSAYVIAPALFKEDELVGINAQTQLAGHVAALLGPLSAGLLFQGAGATITLIIASVLLFASGAILLLLPRIQRPASDDRINLKFVLAGFSHLLRDRAVMTIIVFFATTNVFAAALQVVLPFIAAGLGGSIAYSYLLTAANFGMIVAATVLSVLRLRPAAETIYLTSAFEGLALIALGLVRSMRPAAAAIAVNDAMAGINGNLFVSYLQKSVKSEVLGRAFSASNMMSLVLTPLGFLLAPVVLGKMEAGGFAVAIGAGTLLVSAVFYGLSRAAKLERIE